MKELISYIVVHKDNPRIILSLALAAFCALCLHILYNSTVITVIGFIVILCISLLFTWLCGTLIEKIKSFWRRYREGIRVCQSIAELSDDELFIAYYCIAKNSPSVTLHRDHDCVKSLVKRGFVQFDVNAELSKRGVDRHIKGDAFKAFIKYRRHIESSIPKGHDGEYIVSYVESILSNPPKHLR